ncbi:hypothetical protein J437_LFUL001992 [Ladona fulva]|uniref:Cadherin domain-containing protein n=1 Tax=Ladona fulva TaxID=123851 RepID=A0A8K0NW65_LADFU|nr:hypothetical protein J437_LFUL001992 [Ladona fulva]
MMTVPVFVKHTATVPPETGLGFADDSFTISIPENVTKPGFLLKVLTILNARAHDLVPLECVIINGNEEEDKDSGKYGKIEYKIVPNGVTTDYFTIGNTSGIIRSKRSLEGLNANLLPLRFAVEARDNPSSKTETNAVQVPVVINLIEESHRMILVIDDATPEVVKNKESMIVSVLKDHSKMVVGVEKVVPRQYLAENNTIESDNTGTDVWFYVIDPETETILDRNNTRVQRSILDKESVSNITFDLSGNLKATASGIHGPLMILRTKAAILVSWDVFPYALIVIACIILVLGLVGIIYICVSWSRYKAYKERMQRLYVVPRFDPVFVEPNLKEYETQVLQMSVPLDDSDSYNDLQLDFSSKNHAFSLDNVSYITKANGGQQSPVSSDAATTARASSIAGGTGGRATTGGNAADGSKSNLLGNSNLLSPVTNPLYERSSDDEGHGHMNASVTNENVTFREKKDYSHLGFTYLGDRSPVETTTEL